MNVIELFAGTFGGGLGALIGGHRVVAAVEIGEYPRAIIQQRIRDGAIPDMLLWDDVRTFNALQCPWYRMLRGRVGCVSGGFPCQDVSTAGKGQGVDGARSSLWTQAVRVAVFLRAPFIFLENSPALAYRNRSGPRKGECRGLDRVLGALGACGYAAEWDVFSAQNVGAPHERERVWILAAQPDEIIRRRAERRRAPADADGQGEHVLPEHAEVASAPQAPDSDPKSERCGQGRPRGSDSLAPGKTEQALRDAADTDNPFPNEEGERTRRPESRRSAEDAPNTQEPRLQGGVRDEVQQQLPAHRAWWGSEPDVPRVDDGTPNRVERIRALGNAQVPAVHALAFRILFERLLRD